MDLSLTELLCFIPSWRDVINEWSLVLFFRLTPDDPSSTEPASAATKIHPQVEVNQVFFLLKENWIIMRGHSKMTSREIDPPPLYLRDVIYEWSLLSWPFKGSREWKQTFRSLSVIQRVVWPLFPPDWEAVDPPINHALPFIPWSLGDCFPHRKESLGVCLVLRVGCGVCMAQVFSCPCWTSYVVGSPLAARMRAR